MEKFNGFKAEKAVSVEALPAGGYVAKILNAKEEIYGWGSVLVISFDIAEGDFAGHFKARYANRRNEDEKWKGNLRLTVPVEGSQYYDSNLRSFNSSMWAIEASNKGYHWDWNEANLKGKMVGVVFRNREWEMNGNTGWTTECAWFEDVNAIRSRDFKMPKDKPLANKTANSTSTITVGDVSDFEDILSNDGVPFF